MTNDETLYDEDNPRWTKEDFARAHPVSELPPEVLANFPKTASRLGRPKAQVRKAPVNLRLDPSVVEAFKADGPGWQTRMNAVLAEHVAAKRKA